MRQCQIFILISIVAAFILHCRASELESDDFEILSNLDWGKFMELDESKFMGAIFDGESADGKRRSENLGMLERVNLDSKFLQSIESDSAALKRYSIFCELWSVTQMIKLLTISSLTPNLVGLILNPRCLKNALKSTTSDWIKLISKQHIEYIKIFPLEAWHIKLFNSLNFEAAVNFKERVLAVDPTDGAFCRLLEEEDIVSGSNMKLQVDFISPSCYRYTEVKLRPQIIQLCRNSISEVDKRADLILNFIYGVNEVLRYNQFVFELMRKHLFDDAMEFLSIRSDWINWTELLLIESGEPRQYIRDIQLWKALLDFLKNFPHEGIQLMTRYASRERSSLKDEYFATENRKFIFEAIKAGNNPAVLMTKETAGKLATRVNFEEIRTKLIDYPSNDPIDEKTLRSYLSDLLVELESYQLSHLNASPSDETDQDHSKELKPCKLDSFTELRILVSYYLLRLQDHGVQIMRGKKKDEIQNLKSHDLERTAKRKKWIIAANFFDERLFCKLGLQYSGLEVGFLFMLLRCYSTNKSKTLKELIFLLAGKNGEFAKDQIERRQAQDMLSKS